MSEEIMDLQPFCGSNDLRFELHKPFSRGDHTYATDGAICIRVPRRDDTGEQPEVGVQNLPWDKPFDYVLFPDIKLPPQIFETKECDCYEGHEHECPDCECICEGCNGTGEVKFDSDSVTSVNLFGQHFALKYIRKIAALPGAQIAPVTELSFGRSGIAFKFDGGDGVLMCLRHAFENSIDGGV